MGESAKLLVLYVNYFVSFLSPVGGESAKLLILYVIFLVFPYRMPVGKVQRFWFYTLFFGFSHRLPAG